MSVRVRVPLLLALSVLTTAQALPARADDLIWTAKASDGLIGLSYGPLDPAKAPLFLLSCFDGMGIAVLDLRQSIEGAKPGDALTIALSSGTAKVEVAGEAARDDGAGMIFAEASDIAVKPVLEVLRQAGPASVTVGAASVSLSDKGRAEAVERFSKDCPLD